MPEPITAKQLGVLLHVSRHPKISLAGLLAATGATRDDLAYLLQNDLIREREPGCFLVSHLGGLVLKRS